jgi:hypothetical protein
MVLVAHRFTRHLGQAVKQPAEILEGDKGSAPDFSRGKLAIADERIELRLSDAESPACLGNGTGQRLSHLFLILGSYRMLQTWSRQSALDMNW